MVSRPAFTGALSRKTGRLENAGAIYRQAADQYGKLESDLPDDAGWRAQLGDNFQRLGHAFKEIDLLRKVTSNTLKLRSNMRNYPDLIDKNIRYSYAVFKSKRQSLRHSVMRGLNGRIRKTG